jgi:hypothetical protein
MIDPTGGAPGVLLFALMGVRVRVGKGMKDRKGEIGEIGEGERGGKYYS